MKKIKKSLPYIVSSALMTFPILAAAQFGVPQGTGLQGGSIYGIISNFMNWILGLVGIIGVIGFAIAGVLYLTAAGDEERINTAKRAMMYSIIGVIVALVGIVILKAVQGMLGAQSQF